MSEKNDDYKNELRTEQDDWIRLFDLPGIVEKINDSPCGGAGSCGKCRVLVLEGECTPPSEEEIHCLTTAELAQGIRLACYCQIKGKVRLGFSQKAVPQILLNNHEFSGVFDRDSSSKLYGMAVDLGTTSVVGSLFCLETGEKMNTSSRLNPQCNFGLDVMSRLDYASRPGGTERLQCRILECLDEITVENCILSGIEATEIKEVVITGHTVMLHLLAGVNPSAMGHFPYKPVFTSALHVPANSLGLKVAVNATLLFMPSASAFIGSDIVGGLLATDLDQENDNTFLLDLGTNGEMVLFSNNKLWACSVAVGPALEGMNIECGMRAEEGAVDQVWIENEKICLHIIGECQASGLCGSGLIETVAVIWNLGIVAANGRMIHDHRHNASSVCFDHITETEEGRRFWLIPPDEQERGLYISQKDIRQIQLAKGAISSGIKLLLDAAGIKAQEVQKVNLAGALGNYINSDVLIELGFFPCEWRNKIRPVGNTALLGASIGLMSNAARIRADQVSRQISCLDLTSCKEFQNLFISCMSFGSTGWTPDKE